MATDITICNSALLKIGVERINSFSEDSKAARLCKEQYGKIRDELLEHHYWNFAMKRVTLALLPGNPLFDYDFAHQLPIDCVRVRKTIDDIIFVVEGRTLLSNSKEISIQYISSDVNASQYSRVFSEALAYRLAADLAYPLVQSISLTDKMDQKALRWLKDARGVDGQEGALDNLQADVWTNSRQRGRGWSSV